MVKVAQMDLPPGYQALLDKILAYYDNQIYPTWAGRFFHKTRSAKARNKEKTYLPGVRTYWAGLDASRKAIWKSYGAFMKWNGYLYFTSQYSYQKKHNLGFDLSPTEMYQLYGLKISNPGGSSEVRCIRQDITLTGPVAIQFRYKKTQYSLPADQGFRFHLDLYYFQDGANYVDSFGWVSPNGDVGWSWISQSFGAVDRHYFHSVLTFYLDNYDADVFLDNFLISDFVDDVCREAWKIKDGGVWAYEPFYRKRGWSFEPSYSVPFFDVVYLG